MSFFLGLICGAVAWAFLLWLFTGDLFGRPRKIVIRTHRRKNPGRRRGEREAPDEELKRLRKMAGLE